MQKIMVLGSGRLQLVHETEKNEHLQSKITLQILLPPEHIPAEQKLIVQK